MFLDFLSLRVELLSSFAMDTEGIAKLFYCCINKVNKIPGFQFSLIGFECQIP